MVKLQSCKVEDETQYVAGSLLNGWMRMNQDTEYENIENKMLPKISI